MAKKDLTPQEAVIETSKLVDEPGYPAVGIVVIYGNRGRQKWVVKVWCGPRSSSYTIRGRTLRSCLAKLKKEAG